MKIARRRSRPAQVAALFADRGAGAANATRAHALVEYVERCAHFVDGRPRNCWVDRTYAQRPACKRYLYKGLYGDHVAVYAALFPAARLGVLRAERLFDAATRDAALASLVRFLGFAPRAGAAAPAKTCWHDCGTKKAALDLPPDLRADLDALYAPSERRLAALLAAGRATAL